MSFLKRAISRGISEGIGKAVSQAVTKVVEPKATEYANKAAQRLDNAANSNEAKVAKSGLEGAFANLERAAQNYATEMSKNVKICPECGQPAGLEMKFCQSCGAKLPEKTMAEEAVCPECGKQNAIGTKFCQDCGTKLPVAIAEENAKKAKDEAVMAQWSEKLATFPVWTQGGSDYNIEDYGEYMTFGASFNGNAAAAQQAVMQYKQVLIENGFRPAGQYPSEDQLYKMIGDKCWNVDVEHCFDGDSDYPTICFAQREPTGGFDYVKPEKEDNPFGNLMNMFKKF